MLNNSYYMIHCLVWLLTVFLYIPIFSVLYSSCWKASDYTHAYFILPLLYLLLLVPIPIGIIDDITLPLRYGISVVTEVALKSFHYPVGRKGLLLFIGDNELFMGQPCFLWFWFMYIQPEEPCLKRVFWVGNYDRTR